MEWPLPLPLLDCANANRGCEVPLLILCRCVSCVRSTTLGPHRVSTAWASRPGSLKDSYRPTNQCHPVAPPLTCPVMPIIKPNSHARKAHLDYLPSRTYLLLIFRCSSLALQLLPLVSSRSLLLLCLPSTLIYTQRLHTGACCPTHECATAHRAQNLA